MQEIFKNTLFAGIAIFISSYGGLLLAISLFPSFFVDYISPVFNSDGSRDVFFYLHPFILSLALAVFWNRFQSMFRGHFVLRGFEFGFIYAAIALIPVMWITYSAVDVSLSMVFTWLLYGIFQSCVAGIIFAWRSHLKLSH